MAHVTVFSGSEIRLSGRREIVLTIFGGIDIYKPTLAKRIMEELQNFRNQPAPVTATQPVNDIDRLINYLSGRNPDGSHRTQSQRTTYILTIFGGVDLIAPTLVQEYLEIRELVNSGTISPAEWSVLAGRMLAIEENESISSLTLFGGLSHTTPNKKEEEKQISSARNMGLLNTDEEMALRSVSGQNRQQVRSLLRQVALGR
ncbi:MAG: hypothetical protein HJJLKODD_01522 [Phycisphaerae bacterium]|nr:hypothetical protein [Phycisphaerae bacterium]